MWLAMHVYKKAILIVALATPLCMYLGSKIIDTRPVRLAQSDMQCSNPESQKENDLYFINCAGSF